MASVGFVTRRLFRIPRGSARRAVSRERPRERSDVTAPRRSLPLDDSKMANAGRKTLQNQGAHVWMMKKAQIPDAMLMQCEPFLAHMRLSGIEWRDIVLALAGMEVDELCDDWNDWHTRWSGL